MGRLGDGDNEEEQRILGKVNGYHHYYSVPSMA